MTRSELIQWNGTPREIGDLFRLHKNRREARAVIFSHMFGWEVRLLVGSKLEIVQTQVCHPERVLEHGRTVESSDARERLGLTAGLTVCESHVAGHHCHSSRATAILQELAVPRRRDRARGSRA